MAPDERALALLTIEADVPCGTRTLLLGGVRLLTFYPVFRAGGQADAQKEAEACRAAVAEAIAGAVRAALEEKQGG